MCQASAPVAQNVDPGSDGAILAPPSFLAEPVRTESQLYGAPHAAGAGGTLPKLFTSLSESKVTMRD